MLEKLPEAVGHALEHQRAGIDKIVFNANPPAAGMGRRIEITAPAFAPDSPLRKRFTADGEGISAPLSWRNDPAAAATLVLIVEDAKSPTPEPLVHAIVVDMSPRESGLQEGVLSRPPEASLEKSALNSYLLHGWLPPDPPPGHGVHRYGFRIFTLTAGPPLPKSPGRREVVTAIRERAIARGCLIGTYQREAPVRVEDDTREAAAAS